MNDKEKESIADAFREIGKIFCGLAEMFRPVTTEAESEYLFETEADAKCTMRKPRRCFRRMVYVKFEGRNWKKYMTVKNFYEEIARRKLDSAKDTPFNMSHLSSNATHDDMIHEFKKLVVMELARLNYPQKLEKIARETVDGDRYEA